MIKTLTIDGRNIHGIGTFYDEINRVFMTEEAWKLGQSLDALNDMLYGAYGAAQGDQPIRLMWTDFEKNRLDLGVETTLAFYGEKLKYPDKFDNELIRMKMADLESGKGKTFFDLVLEIIGDHPRIDLIAQ